MEGVEKVVWVLALLPRWWFVQSAAVGVVNAVSCFYRINFVFPGMFRINPKYPSLLGKTQDDSSSS